MKRFLITPVRNEAHLLEAFIRHHSPLFEHIVIADQQSTDGSWEIANAYPNVIALRNDSQTYDERFRRMIMLSEVERRHPGALVMGLDADEFLLAEPADWKARCEEWIRNHPGKTIRFHWNYLHPNGADWFIFDQDFCRPVLEGKIKPGYIHLPRIPLTAEKLLCDEFPILHLNLYWRRRMQMKVWWYQALEVMNGADPSIDSLRLYSRNAACSMPHRHSVPEKFEPSIRRILDSLCVEDFWDTWHKNELLEMLASDKDCLLSTIPIWSFPWQTELSAAGLPAHAGPSLRCRLMEWWMQKTNSTYKSAPVRFIDAILRRI
jgi:hypothetical protein